MKFQLFTRKVHYWLSVFVAAPSALIFLTGLLLQIKKSVSWIQPAERRGSGKTPSVAFADVFDRARSIPELAVNDWSDIDRVDVRPGRGMLKVLANNRWEAQIDAATGDILQVAYRRSDVIEQIHDGSWFSAWIKSGLFTPTAAVLLIMWVSGVYLFVLPFWRRRRRAPGGG